MLLDDEELSSTMDLITQLQDETQRLLAIMSSSIGYLSSRANFAQVSPEIPITKRRPADKVDSPEALQASKRELVVDLIRKAKQVDYLIQALPDIEPETSQMDRLQCMVLEMQQINDEYRRAVARAKRLHSEMSSLLRSLLEEYETDCPG